MGLRSMVDRGLEAIAKQSPIKNYRDLVEHKEPVTFDASGIGSAAYVETVMLTSALKLPIKILTGYSGNDDMLAMRRGEVVGSISARATATPPTSGTILLQSRPPSPAALCSRRRL